MRRIALPMLCMMLMAGAQPLLRAEDPTDPDHDTFDTLHVAGSVHMLRTNTAITNTAVCASVGEDGTLLVDASFPRLAAKLTAAAEALGGGKVRFVISTHHHWDHAWGNEFFGANGAVIIAHSNLRERLLDELLPDDSGGTIDPAGLPVLTTDSSLTLHFNGEQVKVIAMPHGGHTGGDTVAYFSGSKVLCAGDYYFAGRYPIIDVEAGGSLQGYLSNAQLLLDSYPAETRIVPGHGTFPPEEIRIHTLGEYGEWIASLKDSIAHIRDRKAAGLTAEQIGEEGLPERFAPLGARPRFVSEVRWIEGVYAQIP